jgi:hypothetical protein
MSPRFVRSTKQHRYLVKDTTMEGDADITSDDAAVDVIDRDNVRLMVMRRNRTPGGLHHRICVCELGSGSN